MSQPVRIFATGAVIVAVAALIQVATHAYDTFAKWAASPVLIYVNPQNADVSAASAEAAIQTGINAWNNESDSNFRFIYAGRTGDTSVGYDNRNVAVFRDTKGGSAIATTYSWSSGSTLLDADIVFWDGAYQFFAGTSGCAGGVYIEDVATHELGHALGLLHSGDSDATMYPTMSQCSQTPRTLASDDIAGVRSLYGRFVGDIPNSPPSVSITAPENNAVFAAGSSIAFSGSASDSQDGSLTPSLAWTSSLDGALGTGGYFSRTLSTGVHIITAGVNDSGGLLGSKAVTVTVSAEAAIPTSPRVKRPHGPR